MKYICLGYLEPGKFEGMTEDERHATFDECFEYNDHLRANGHLVAEVPLQPPETALTLYWKNGKVATTDGPYAETKEQLGGIQILEARDLNHAVQLVSQQPGFKYGLGPIEIRPVMDWSEIIRRASSGDGERRPRDEGGHEGKNDQDHGQGQHDYGAGNQHRFPCAEGGGTVG